MGAWGADGSRIERLESSTNTLVTEAASLGVVSLAVRKDEVFSNRFPFIVEDWPEVREREANNDSAGAQSVTLPVVVNGRIDQPGTWMFFKSTAWRVMKLSPRSPRGG